MLILLKNHCANPLSAHSTIRRLADEVYPQKESHCNCRLGES